MTWSSLLAFVTVFILSCIGMSHSQSTCFRGDFPRMLSYNQQTADNPITYNAVDLDSTGYLYLGGHVPQSAIIDSCAQNIKPFFEAVQYSGSQIFGKVITTEGYCDILSVKTKNVSPNATPQQTTLLLVSTTNDKELAFLFYDHSSNTIQYLMIVSTQRYNFISPNQIFLRSANTAIFADPSSDYYNIHLIDYQRAISYQTQIKSKVENYAAFVDVVGDSSQYLVSMGMINSFAYINILVIQDRPFSMTPKKSLKLDSTQIGQSTADIIDMSARFKTNSQNKWIEIASCLKRKRDSNTYALVYEMVASTFAKQNGPSTYLLDGFECRNIEAMNSSLAYVFLEERARNIPCFGYLRTIDDSLEIKWMTQFQNAEYFTVQFGFLQYSNRPADQNGFFVGQTSGYLSTFQYPSRAAYIMTVNSALTSLKISDVARKSIDKNSIIQFTSDSIYNQFTAIQTISLVQVSTFPTLSTYYNNNFTLSFPKQRNLRNYNPTLPAFTIIVYYAGANPKITNFLVGSFTQCSDGELRFNIKIEPFLTLATVDNQFQVTAYSSQTQPLGEFENYIETYINNGQYFERYFKVLVKSLPESQCYREYDGVSSQDQVYLYYGVGQDPLIKEYALTRLPSSCTFTTTVTPISPVSIDRSVFSFTSNTITIFTSDISKYGQYQMMMKFYIDDSDKIVNVPYLVTIRSKCFDTEIFSQSLSKGDQILYDISQGTEITDRMVDWKQLYSEECPSLSYALLDDNFNLVDQNTSPIVFDPQNLIIKVYTTSSSHIGNYVMYIRGFVKNSTETYQQKDIRIDITIEDKCKDKVISKGESTPNQFYRVGQEQLLVKFTQMHVYPANCGSVIYAALLNGQDPSNFSFIKSGPDFEDFSMTIYTTELSIFGKYSMKIYGQVFGEMHIITTFLINIQSPCQNILVQHSQLVDLIFSFQVTIQYFQIQDFTTNEPISTECGILKSTLTKYDGNPLDQNLMTLIESTLKITASETRYDLCETEQILKYSGFLSNVPSIRQDLTFKVLFRCGCDSVSLTTFYDQNYIIHYNLEDTNEPEPFRFSEFKVDNSKCLITDPVTYTISLVSQSSPLDLKQILSIEPQNSIGENLLKMQTTQNPKFIGEHIISISGTIVYREKTIYKEILAKIKIVGDCSNAIVTSQPVFQETPYKYIILGSPLIINFDKWQLSPSYCEQQSSYSLIVGQNSFTASVDLDTQKISIYSEDFEVFGLFEFQLKASFGPELEELVSFKVDVSNKCQTTKLSIPPQKLFYSFNIESSSPFLIPILSFVPNIECGIVIRYSLKVQSNEGKSTSHISLLNQQQTIKVDPEKDRSLAGSYSVDVIGQIQDQEVLIINQFRISINLKSNKNTAPYFLTSLSILKLY